MILSPSLSLSSHALNPALWDAVGWKDFNTICQLASKLEMSAL